MAYVGGKPGYMKLWGLHLQVAVTLINVETVMKTLWRQSMFVLFGLLLANASAYAAQWVGVQGTSAVLEYPGNTTGSYYRGWGLDFTEKAYNTNWVHVPVPTSIGSQQARYIWVNYYKQYAGASIGQVDIYNGGTYLQTVYPSNSSTAGWNWILVDLGTYKSFPYGLSVSLYTVPAYGLNTNFKIGAAYVLEQ